MSIRTFSGHVKAKPSIVPLLRDNVAINGSGVDCAGYDRAAAVISLGATDIACTVSLEDSPDNSTWSAVTGSDVATTATDDNKVFLINVDLAKRARYLRVVAPAADGTAGTTIGAVVLLTGGRSQPPTQDNAVVSV